ncbi:hypothetical protein [Methanobrevibacter sp.]|uniref:hypothetical protein n=1 Tax=Methanobrevibacter sp. TaxID=66852 RepID=UPI00388D2BAA
MPIESSQYPFHPTSSIIEAIVMVMNAPAIPTPVKEKSSVRENWLSGCPKSRDSRMDATITIANTITAQTTFIHFTL